MFEKYKQNLIDIIEQIEGVNIKFDIGGLREMILVCSNKNDHSIAVCFNSTTAFGKTISIFGNDEDLNLDLNDENFTIIVEELKKQINHGHYLDIFDANGEKTWGLVWCEKTHIDAERVLKKFQLAFEPEVQKQTVKICYCDFLGRNPIVLTKKSDIC